MVKQVKSKERVVDHGEVFTAKREVNAMLDLVKQETERIESRFLEPACGDGNFLAEVLRRKLAIVKRKYRRSKHDYEMYSVIAVSSIYGVELLSDNVEECRNRLFKIWDDQYVLVCKNEANDICREAVMFILARNILCGDALTMRQVDGGPIIFSQWDLAMGTCLKRRDYRLDELLEEDVTQISIFMTGWEYDEKIQAYVPKPIAEYPLVDYRRVQDYE